jgi:Protein of unknown function (DUF3146)
MKNLPETTAYLSITSQSWQHGKIAGEVRASTYQWSFEWRFRQSKLLIKPSLGKSLIVEPLTRFLERSDYQLEPGGNYEFTVRSDF